MENDSPVLVEIQTGKEWPSHTKEIAAHIGFPFKPFRPKTRSVNRFWMNMKVLLNPRFNKKQVISVQDSSSDDEGSSRSKELEFSLHQVFDYINQSLKQIPDLAPQSFIYNSSDIEDNNLSKIPKTDIGKILKNRRMQWAGSYRARKGKGYKS